MHDMASESPMECPSKADARGTFLGINTTTLPYSFFPKALRRVLPVKSLALVHFSTYTCSTYTCSLIRRRHLLSYICQLTLAQLTPVALGHFFLNLHRPQLTYVNLHSLAYKCKLALVNLDLLTCTGELGPEFAHVNLHV